MSVKAFNWAVEQPLPPGPKNVLNMLAWHADADGACFPGQRRLAAMTGFNVRSVMRYLADLEQRGLITSHRRHRKGGSRSSNSYVLVGYLRWLSGLPPKGSSEPSQGDTVSRSQGDTVSRSEVETRRQPVATKVTPCRNLGDTVSGHELSEESTEESKALSLRASNETGATPDEPRAANAAERETQPPSEKGGQSRAKGRSRAKGKGSHEGEVEASRSDHRAYREAWNEHRGNLAECTRIDARRRAWIDAHEHEHGADALTMFTNAVRNVATERVWFAKNYAFDELFKFGCIVEHHEKWNSGHGMSAGDRHTATIVAEIERATRDAAADKFWADPEPEPEPARFTKGDAARHPEFGDVTVTGYDDDLVTVERDDGFTERVRAAELLRLRRPPTGPRPAAVDSYIRSKRTEPEPEPEPVVAVELEASPDLDAEPSRSPAPLTNGQPSKPELTDAERAQRDTERRELLRQQAATLQGRDT